MAKKKTPKKRADSYEKKLSVNASFEDLVKLSVKKTTEKTDLSKTNKNK